MDHAWPTQYSIRRKKTLTKTVLVSTLMIMSKLVQGGFAVTKNNKNDNLSSPTDQKVTGGSSSRFFQAKKRKASPVSSPAKRKIASRTHSFDALTAADFPQLCGKNIKPHTLILGTHPSIKSLEKEQYYGHPMNAFWWIAGDCLGFRRASGTSPSTNKQYGFTDHLRYSEEHVIPYEDQVCHLIEKGFSLWDVIGSCKRSGSLDQAIRDEVPNDIRGFCTMHQSIRRIVFANGGTACALFIKHNKEWLQSGELVSAQNEQSQKAFEKVLRKVPANTDRTISLISALAVSPAAASYSYQEKRDFWEEFVYGPGLEDHENKQKRS